MAVEPAGILCQVVTKSFVDLTLRNVEDVGRFLNGKRRPEHIEDLIACDQVVIHEEEEQILREFAIPVRDRRAVDQRIAATQ